MARHGVTYEEVAKAATELARQRQNPTVEKVRAALDDTGSYATISKHLNTWRAQYFGSQSHSSIEEPVVAPEAVSHVVTNLWEQLTHQATAQVESIKKDYAEKVAKVMEEQALLQQERDEAVESLNKATVKINHLGTDITLLKKELAAARQQCELVEQQAKHSEATLKLIQAETKGHIEQLETVHASSLQSLKQQLQTLRESYDQEKDDWKALIEKQRTSFVVELDKLKVAKEKTEKLNSKLETELQQLLQRNKELAEKNRALETDLTVARERQQAAEKEVAVLTSQNVLKDSKFNYFKELLDGYFKKVAKKH